MKFDNSIFAFLIPLFFFWSCNGGQMQHENSIFPSIGNVSDEQLKRLSEIKIFFGHQSVGFNIINGIQDLMKENSKIKLNIVETADKSDFNAGLFAHARAGNNTKPKSKIDAFKNFIEKGIGNQADIAFLKFCYIDFNEKTDVANVFADYREVMSRLKNSYPKTTFVHVTVPLTSLKTGLKAFTKKIIGRPIRGYSDNIKRHQFNELMKAEYSGKDPVFDLAEIESTYPAGKRSTFSKDGTKYYSMVPEYTYDGGHLNETGRKIVAEQMLVLLSDIAK